MTDRLLYEPVRHWADRSPDATAVQAEARTCSYGELEAASNRLARCLRALGLRPGDRVALHLPKSIEAVVSMLGVLKAGGAYVPIDPLSPPGRARLIVQTCAPRIVITRPWILGALTAEAELPGCVDGLVLVGPTDASAPDSGHELVQWPEVERLSGEPSDEPTRTEDDLAYILNTSGSSGVPKGVMLSHRNAMAFVDWACNEFGVTCTDRLANHAPLHFDLSVFDLYAAFHCGAQAVLISEWAARAPRELVQLVVARGLTIWYSVPSALVLMLEHGGLEAAAPESLRLVLFAGEVLPIKYLPRLMRATPRARLYNLYGPTETNVCTFYRVKPDDAERVDPLPIGRACSGDRLSVLDEEGNPVARGALGSLWVEGPTVMLGYWSLGSPAALPRRYCTGDLVSWTEDGDLLYHGRKDSMVKVRGYRVEIGEVETALARHPDVLEAAVVPLRDQRERTYLAAAVTPRHPALSVLDVKRHCARALPDYMIPQVVRFLTRLPRTSTGKVDRVSISRTLDGKLLP